MCNSIKIDKFSRKVNVKVYSTINFLIYLVFTYAYISSSKNRQYRMIYQYFRTFDMHSSLANIEKSIFRDIAQFMLKKNREKPFILATVEPLNYLSTILTILIQNFIHLFYYHLQSIINKRNCTGNLGSNLCSETLSFADSWVIFWQLV